VKVARRRRPTEAQCTRSLGLGYKLCAVIPVAGQRTYRTTFRPLKVSSQVATLGAEFSVYDCLVVVDFLSSNVLIGDMNKNCMRLRCPNLNVWPYCPQCYRTALSCFFKNFHLRSKNVTCGRRFWVAARRVWNSFPQEIKNCENLGAF